MGKFRATKHPYRMSLMNSTIVTPCPSLSDDMYLDLAAFDAFSDEAQCPENILVDIIGQVVDVGEMKTHNVNNKIMKKLEFELRNTKSTFWGRFAETLMAACENSGDKKVICLMRFAKITTFKGVRSISNAFDMSLLLIDPDYPEAFEFVQNLPQDGLALTLQVHVPKEQNVVKKVEHYNRFPRNTIQELLHSPEIQVDPPCHGLHWRN
ncbi:unnamed protein product [Arabidopsis arenosa]|uniref:Uncharacterized protein n=1 Tax=Arabidopsis arenosa TaxID=38785 RepID=A0A8S1ZLZ0_ARAAE|nr:unnamed protein product [Arabidopsis arenosa]